MNRPTLGKSLAGRYRPKYGVPSVLAGMECLTAMVNKSLTPPFSLGNPVPDVTVQTHDGRPFRLLDHLGQPMVLFFYPQDDTEGCTLEVQEFDGLLPEFERSGISLFGISPDSVASHQAFRAKYGLGLSLLSDPGHRAADAFGLWREKTTFGRTYVGLVRTTVLIHSGGTAAALVPAPRIKGHAAQVLAHARATWDG
jgi:peroxiredoxin Q/BCP